MMDVKKVNAAVKIKVTIDAMQGRLRRAIQRGSCLVACDKIGVKIDSLQADLDRLRYSMNSEELTHYSARIK